MLKRWEDLPEFMKTDEVRPYYETLKKKKISLALKRIMDLVGGIILLVLLALPMLFIAIWIKLDSKGPNQLRGISFCSLNKIESFSLSPNEIIA